MDGNFILCFSVHKADFFFIYYYRILMSKPTETVFFPSSFFLKYRAETPVMRYLRGTVVFLSIRGCAPENYTKQG